VVAPTLVLVLAHSCSSFLFIYTSQLITPFLSLVSDPKAIRLVCSELSVFVQQLSIDSSGKQGRMMLAKATLAVLNKRDTITSSSSSSVDNEVRARMKELSKEEKHAVLQEAVNSLELQKIQKFFNFILENRTIRQLDEEQGRSLVSSETETETETETSTESSSSSSSRSPFPCSLAQQLVNQFRAIMILRKARAERERKQGGKAPYFFISCRLLPSFLLSFSLFTTVFNLPKKCLRKSKRKLERVVLFSLL
jgi:hypothetical protein